MPQTLTAYVCSGERLRSRSVGPLALCGQVDIPAPPAHVLADWQRDVREHLALACGDVEPLSLSRTRMRWPALRECVQAVGHWLGPRGLSGVLAHSDMALMACRAARYHHDGVQYGSKAFCNVFLSEDRGLDLHFPGTGQRIALQRGVVVVFDTCQPHAVVLRGSAEFVATDFPPGRDCTQVFLTWELPLEEPAVAQALQVQWDTDARTAANLLGDAEGEGMDAAGVWCDGAPAQLCARTGRWLPQRTRGGLLGA